VTAVADLSSYGSRLGGLEANVIKLQDITQGLDGHFGPDGNMSRELDDMKKQNQDTANALRSLNSYLNRGPRP